MNTDKTNVLTALFKTTTHAQIVRKKEGRLWIETRILQLLHYG